MYTPRSRRILRFVKRLHFYLEVESDDALGAEAAREGISKAEIIRRLVTNHLGRSVDVDPIKRPGRTLRRRAGPRDDVVYGS